jgi:hypothetical protein
MRLLEQISRCSSPQQRMALDLDEPLTLTKGVFSSDMSWLWQQRAGAFQIKSQHSVPLSCNLETSMSCQTVATHNSSFPLHWTRQACLQNWWDLAFKTTARPCLLLTSQCASGTVCSEGRRVWIGRLSERLSLWCCRPGGRLFCICWF